MGIQIKSTFTALDGRRRKIDNAYYYLSLL